MATDRKTELEKQFHSIAICSLCQTIVGSPKILPCFHSFCHSCLNEKTRPIGNLENGVTPCCATCRAEYHTQINALPTNEFLDRITATANALSSKLNIPGFQRTGGSASHPAQPYPPYCGHDSKREKLSYAVKNLFKSTKVGDEASRQSRDKKQQNPFCTTHRQLLDKYCNNCTQVMCKLCIGKEHRSHKMIDVDLAIKNLHRMIDSYLHGVTSCQTYYRAQNDIREAVSEGRTAEATMNRVGSTRHVKPNSKGSVKSGKSTQILPASPLSRGDLDSWEKYTRDFYEEITARGSIRNICNISKELNKFHEAWKHECEQHSPVGLQLSQNTTSSNTVAVGTAARVAENRRELKGTEQRSQKSLSTLSRPKSKMSDTFPTRTVSPHNQTRNESSVVQHQRYEQQKLLEQITRDREYSFNEIATRDKKERLLIDDIERLESQVRAIKMEKEHLTTLYIEEKESHEMYKSRFLEHLKGNSEWIHEKEQCNDSLREFKLEKDKLEEKLRQHQKSNADIQKKLREQVQRKERLMSELEKIIPWIERIDKQSAELHTTTDCDSDDGIIDKLKVLIVKQTRERSEEKRILLARNEKLSHMLEELQSKASSREITHQLKSSSVAKKEREEWLIREKQAADRIQELERQIDQLQGDLDESKSTAQREQKVALKREGHVTAELADLKQRIRQYFAGKKQEDDAGVTRELKSLLKWIERGDGHTTEDQLTKDPASDKGIINEIKASITNAKRELNENVKQLSKSSEESNKQLFKLERSLADEETKQRKVSMQFERERDRLTRHVEQLKKSETLLTSKIQELERKIRDLQDALTEPEETNLAVKEKLKIKKKEVANMKQRLECSVVTGKTEISLTQLELERVIKWIDAIGEMTTDKMAAEEESQNVAVQKLKASIIAKTRELEAKEKQFLTKIEESDEQITTLRQSLHSEKQKHQELRNSNGRLHKDLLEKERILAVQAKELNEMKCEILQLQKKRSAKISDQVSPTEVKQLTQATKRKQQRPNTENHCGDSNATSQNAAKRPRTLRAIKGIRNMGNTCYFGATIQNLVHTVLLSDELQTSLSIQPTLGIELLLTKAYVDFLSRVHEQNCDEAVRKMFEEFCKKSSRFADRGQHDSHDLFVNFLNCLRDEERRRRGSVNSSGFRSVLTAVDKVFGGHVITVYVCSSCKAPYHVCEPFIDISVPILEPENEEEDEDEGLFNSHLREPQSIGHADDERETTRQAIEVTMRPLGARSRLKTRQGMSHKRSSMSDSSGITSLNQCLACYSRIERIHDEYLCSHCQSDGRPSMTSALKRTLIYNPPAILVLHLKRFEQTTYGFKKCNQTVAYDEYLDIGPFCSSSGLRINEAEGVNVWYSLYGVVVHKGSLTSGHYVSYVKVRDCDTRQTEHFKQQTFLNRDHVLNEDDVRRINKGRGMHKSRKEWAPREVEGQWYLADDEYVKAVDKTEALSQTAYLLFYERVAKQKDSVV